MSDDADFVRARRRQVIVYLAVVLVASAPLEILAITNPSDLITLAGVAVLMWIPGLVALVQRRIEGASWRELGFLQGPRRYWLIAYLAPVGCAVLAYAGGMLSRTVTYSPAPGHDFGGTLVFQATVGVFFGGALALGEELGWRGHLLPRLIEARLPAPLWLAAIARAVWYLPLAVAQSALLAVVGVPLIFVAATLTGVFTGWLRLASASIWPAVIAHSAHNVFYESVLGPGFDGRLEPLFSGEAGVFSIVAYALVVLWLWRTKRLAERAQPAAELSPATS